MSTPTIHVPPAEPLRGPMIFDRRYRSRHTHAHEGPGTCRRCGRDLMLVNAHRLYCSRTCRQAIAQLPQAERVERRAAAVPGLCVRCGMELPPDEYRCPKGGAKAWIRRWRKASGGKLRFGPEAWEWLAEKLGTEPADERLPEIALQLARAGQLTVLVDRGQVVGVAKVRKREEARTEP